MPTLSEDRDAIRDLYARYCLYIDTGAADEWAATFTVDAEFLAGGDPLVGREALRAFASSLPTGTLHHMVLNETIDIEGDAAKYSLVRSRATLRVPSSRRGVLRTSSNGLTAHGGSLAGPSPLTPHKFHSRPQGGCFIVSGHEHTFTHDSSENSIGGCGGRYSVGTSWARAKALDLDDIRGSLAGFVHRTER